MYTTTLTKYERAQVIGVRARQIGSGSCVHVPVDDLVDAIDMATRELDSGKCPLLIARNVPGKGTVWLRCTKQTLAG